MKPLSKILTFGNVNFKDTFVIVEIECMLNKFKLEG